MFFLYLLPDIISHPNYDFIIVKFMLSIKHIFLQHEKSLKYEKMVFFVDVKWNVSDLVCIISKTVNMLLTLQQS